ncbi:uncharacterized protein [Spinacia oleracea]|uniref:Uncharacterized protein n=1 Tax=Spinacia oleracea TaxID=3562 RepID=A0ABM3RLG6_SPIOL|nr:uncharacterized protein LOC130470396 [Spinacia oleracea]
MRNILVCAILFAGGDTVANMYPLVCSVLIQLEVQLLDLWSFSKFSLQMENSETLKDKDGDFSLIHSIHTTTTLYWLLALHFAAEKRRQLVAEETTPKSGQFTFLD